MGSIRVAVDDGALNLRNGRERGDGYYETYELPPLPEAADAEEFYGEFFDRLQDEHGTNVVLMFPDFTQAFSRALNHHLRRHFAHVETPVGSDEGEPNVRVAMDLRDNGIKRAELTVTYGSDQLDAEGERRPRRHLAWAVPLSLVLFPIGELIAQRLMAGVHRRAFYATVAEAIDNAAAALAEHIAAQCVPGANSCIARQPSYQAAR